MSLPLEQQVCSLDLAKRLKELGARQESLFYWLKGEKIFVVGFFDALLGGDRVKIDCAAFTVAELGEMLPQGAASFRRSVENLYRCLPPRTLQHLPSHDADTEADARAKMLIYLLENKLITL